MTCAVAYRPRRRPDRRNANSDYALLAVDGRITDEHGTIYTDKAVKWSQAGRWLCVWAGDEGCFQHASWRLLGAANDPSRKGLLASVRGALDVALNPADRPDFTDSSWEALMYDIIAHELYSADSDGALHRIDSKTAAIGSGADLALGYLAAYEPAGPNWPETQAKLRVRGAIREASKRHASVGPRATLLRVSQDGRVNVRG